MPRRTRVKTNSMLQGGEPHFVLEEARRWALWFSRRLGQIKTEEPSQSGCPCAWKTQAGKSAGQSQLMLHKILSQKIRTNKPMSP